MPPSMRCFRKFRSTLPHGERHDLPEKRGPGRPFRSTLPHGERHALHRLWRHGDGVSIHAPARGATIDACSNLFLKWVSIHAPARGATFACPGRRPAWRSFDPRSRTGSDRLSAPWFIKAHGFDPRSRTGSDLRPPLVVKLVAWFRSTLPHGERRRSCFKRGKKKWFRSTLPHGERPYRLVHACSESPFRSTLPHGERR